MNFFRLNIRNILKMVTFKTILSIVLSISKLSSLCEANHSDVRVNANTSQVWLQMIKFRSDLGNAGRYDSLIEKASKSDISSECRSSFQTLKYSDEVYMKCKCFSYWLSFGQEKDNSSKIFFENNATHILENFNSYRLIFLFSCKYFESEWELIY